MNIKRKPGDSRDGTYLKKNESMHAILPLTFPGRCDNKAFISELTDLTNIYAYPEKNASDPECRYSVSDHGSRKMKSPQLLP